MRLASRHTAARVDDQVADYLRREAIEGPWGAGERLIVCVGADAAAEKLVRHAARQAAALNATWHIAVLSKPCTDASEAARGRIDAALRLAERLGGESTRLAVVDHVEAVARLAAVENATQIILGQGPDRCDDKLAARLVRGSAGAARGRYYRDRPHWVRRWLPLRRSRLRRGNASPMQSLSERGYVAETRRDSMLLIRSMAAFADEQGRREIGQAHLGVFWSAHPSGRDGCVPWRAAGDYSVPMELERGSRLFV